MIEIRTECLDLLLGRKIFDLIVVRSRGCMCIDATRAWTLFLVLGKLVTYLYARNEADVFVIC